MNQDDEYLLFENKANVNATDPPLFHSQNLTRFWSDSIILIEDKHNDDLWNFTAFDLLMNESRNLHFAKSSSHFLFISVYPLIQNFGLAVEWSRNESRVNLVRLDFASNEFQLVKKFEYKCTALRTYIDKLEPRKFVLSWEQENGRKTNYQVGKLAKRKIELGELYESGELFKFYSQDRLIGFEKFIDGSEISTYELNTDKKQTSKIDELDGYFFENSRFEWVKDRLFSSVQCKNTNNYGIVWASLESKQWNLLDFEPKMAIRTMKFFGNGNLVVKLKNSVSKEKKIYESEVKFCAIQMGRPQILRISAWLFLIKIMKQKKENDPYKSAQEFLPLNSDLRSPWFQDNEIKPTD